MSLRFERLFSLLSAGTLLLVSLAGHAASFDCAKATSVTEKAICADDWLSELDNKLSVAWKKVSGFDPVVMKSSQLRWLKLRDACGADASCLTARYSVRLAMLEGWIAYKNGGLAVDADHAGNRLETLMPKTLDELIDDAARRCTADEQFCVQILPEESYYSSPLIKIDYAGANPATYSFTLTGPHIMDFSNMEVTLWPSVLRLAGDNGAILVGVVYKVDNPYSGGGGTASELQLFRVSRNEAAHEVLSVPMWSSVSIRACFSEEHVRDRLGACHDEYSFSASIGLDRTVKSGFPRLVYQTQASSFPGKVSRSEDSLTMPPLRKQDLVYAVEPRCTYKRTFRFENTTGTYMPDKPLPECGDYTNP